MTGLARAAKPSDAAAIARIYSAGIAERVATFETQPRTAVDILAWFEHDLPKVVVVEGDAVIAFAAAFPYSNRSVYAGIVEFSVYVDPLHRGIGAGRAAMTARIEACSARGVYKLTSRIFVDNEASLKLMRTMGFREVGIQMKHGNLEGVWRDVMTVELLIEANL